MRLAGRAIAAALALALIAAPLPARAQDEAAPLPDKIFVQCAVAQGNGYNWAATLAWLAGQVELAAIRAAEYEAAEGGVAALDLGCMTGSSSGAAVTALFDHLLANERVAPGTPGWPPAWIDVDEARKVSQALMFLAFSSNFRGEFRQLILPGIGAFTGLGDRESNATGGDYWRGTSSPEPNIAIFGEWIRGAGLYEPDWWEALFATDATAIPIVTGAPDALDDMQGPAASAALSRTAARARDILDAALDALPPGDAEGFRPIGDGFCATGLAVASDTAPPFDYDDLRLILICNPATARTLAASADLADWLGASGQMADRFVLAEASEWPVVLNISLREPELMTPLSGVVTEPPIGLSGLRAFDGKALAPVVAGDPVVVLGGFADPRLQAWGPTALLADRLGWLAEGEAGADGRIAIFGRVEDRGNPQESFAQQSMVTYFASPSGAAGRRGRSGRGRGRSPRILQLAGRILRASRRCR